MRPAAAAQTRPHPLFAHLSEAGGDALRAGGGGTGGTAPAALVSDLIEPFRTLLVDPFNVWLIRTGRQRADRGFEARDGGIFLDGRLDRSRGRGRATGTRSARSALGTVAQLRQRLERLIKPTLDRVRLWPLSARCCARIVNLGINVPAPGLTDILV